MAARSPGDCYLEIRDSLPPEVTLVAAVKGREASEIAEVIEAGATDVGENYVQEAAAHHRALGGAADRVCWHLIGHLQRNKVNAALPIFRCIQSVDSLRLAKAIDKRADEPVRVLVEVNIAGEESKFGVQPDAVPALVRHVANMEDLRLEGLMTMEPYFDDPEDARPYFERMRALFEEIRGFDPAGSAMKTLSMGMTNSYRVAVEEGANMVRIGTAIFGPRRG